MFNKVFEMITTVAAGVVVYSFLVMMFLMMLLISAVGALICIVIAPFYLIIAKLFGFGPTFLDRAIVEEYNEVAEAFKKGNIPFLETYRDEHPDFPEGVDSFIGHHWLINAIDLGSLESIKWVLDQGVEVNYYDGEGRSPLTSAIQSERKDADAMMVINMLLAYGADVNSLGTLNVTPLHIAAATGSFNIVQFLLERGANPLALDAEYAPEYPVSCASRHKHLRVVALLEKHMEKARASEGDILLD